MFNNYSNILMLIRCSRNMSYYQQYWPQLSCLLYYLYLFSGNFLLVTESSRNARFSNIMKQSSADITNITHWPDHVCIHITTRRLLYKRRALAAHKDRNIVVNTYNCKRGTSCSPSEAVCRVTIHALCWTPPWWNRAVSSTQGPKNSNKRRAWTHTLALVLKYTSEFDVQV